MKVSQREIVQVSRTTVFPASSERKSLDNVSRYFEIVPTYRADVESEVAGKWRTLLFYVGRSKSVSLSTVTDIVPVTTSVEDNSLASNQSIILQFFEIFRRFL